MTDTKKRGAVPNPNKKPMSIHEILSRGGSVEDLEGGKSALKILLLKKRIHGSSVRNRMRTLLRTFRLVFRHDWVTIRENQLDIEIEHHESSNFTCQSIAQVQNSRKCGFVK